MPSVSVRRRTRGYSALPPVSLDLLSSSQPPRDDGRPEGLTNFGSLCQPVAPGVQGAITPAGTDGLDDNIINNDRINNNLTNDPIGLVPGTPTIPLPQSNISIPPPNPRTFSSRSVSNVQRRSRSKTIQYILGHDDHPDASTPAAGTSFDRSGGVDGESHVGVGLPPSGIASPVGNMAAVVLGPAVAIGPSSSAVMSRPGDKSNQVATDATQSRERASTLAVLPTETTRSVSPAGSRDRATTIAALKNTSESQIRSFPSPEAVASAESGQSAGMASVGVRFSSAERDQIRRSSVDGEGDRRSSGGGDRPIGGGLVSESINNNSSAGNAATAAASRRRSGSNASSGMGGRARARRTTLSNVFSFGAHSPSSERGDPMGRAEQARSIEERERDEEDERHEEQVVEHLDVIDPEISAVSHLQNAGNSLMFPPGLFNRKPVLDLPSLDSERDYEEAPQPALGEKHGQTFATGDGGAEAGGITEKSGSTESTPFEDPLDTHVKDVLSKRAVIRRSLKGMWAFLKTPLGVVMGIYGFLVVFWGAAIVLFLLGWINTGSHYNKILWIEISSQVENGLFTITGVGLIPWRSMDVYRIGQIYSLKRRSRELRKKRGLPPIECPDDMPDPLLDPNFIQVLSDKDQALLRLQQEKFMASQTWYRPHATETHTATPIGWGLVICLCILGNSLFQVALDGCMWGFNRFNRPAATTGTLMPASFLCGIAGGVLIWRIGERTKKKKEVKRKLRHVLGMRAEENASSTGLLEAEKSSAAVGPDSPPPRPGLVGSDHDSRSDVGTEKSVGGIGEAPVNTGAASQSPSRLRE